ncbi:carbohydrate ABC transporter substrate-binding protein (CUT1 family) [Streptomyces sp. 1114.5]|uniref:ABC transporter substrate-binding protein n=1 Tax=unclassified Streptomyces TaxID=2593676 RepID=UPI000BC4E56F|nr:MULTISPECIES: ABC transporter substrate-binding protein [unclassified Streptomyces]RKT20096.1 carbohydrate ABC transporter substrate-binding protein (CUT1 family) [Streptomyces sp. 1114.5]SOB86285.1 carbohydrate ABC transporter substrate-binding protein, CUT1 family [Streptomyces sp. 1331.2]
MPRVARIRSRWASAVAGLAVIASALVGCGGGGQGGAVTLNWYNFPDDSGALQQAADRCGQQSGGRYTIHYNKLPRGADGQRQQLVRRMAAHDADVDILGLDVTWPAEFAEAGWIREWTGAMREQGTADTLDAAVRTATWRGRLYAVPYNSNTQLLWYRDDLVPTPPATWAEMLAKAQELAREGKPHLVEIQGAQYEGLTVWFNTLVASAGGSILTPDAQAPALGAPAVAAATVMHDLATSVAADPSLPNQMEDQNRLAMESGSAAFELNYPFVYPSMKANQPTLFPHFRWAPYPAVTPGRPAGVTIGGIDLAVGAYSRHPDLAFEATLCLRDRDNQLTNALKGGLPPSLRSLYQAAELTSSYPFAADVLAALDSASIRPQTPAYQNVSIAISHTLSPPAAIRPEQDVADLRGQIQDALGSKGLIP